MTALFSSNASLWILAGLIAIYIAGRSALDARVDPATSHAGRLGWTMGLMVGLVAAMAVMLGQPAMAVGLLFSVSVAGLSLVVGLTVVLSPLAALPPAARRVWIFLLPVAALALLAGFSGKLTATHAAVLALQGALVLFVRVDPKDGADEDWGAPVLLLDRPEEQVAHQSLWRGMELALAMILVLIGGYFVIATAPMADSPLAPFPDTLVAAGVLSPILLLPLVGIASHFAQRGRVRIVVGASVLLAILNLCVLLPLIVLLWMVRPTLVHLGGRLIGAGAGDGASIFQFNETMIFPMSAWRVDSVVLLILALAALPVALGRFGAGRREGIALIVLYSVYLVANAALAMRY